jgi:hypothetical protein
MIVAGELEHPNDRDILDEANDLGLAITEVSDFVPEFASLAEKIAAEARASNLTKDPRVDARLQRSLKETESLHKK